MSFTEYLLTDDQVYIKLAEIEDYLQPLVPVLKQKNEEFESTMYKNVYDFIEGFDLDKLVLFFKILDSAESETHIKIIKKLKSINTNDIKIDYKNLLERPYETIAPYLTSDDENNLQIFSKLLPKLPIKDKNIELKSSKLYALWCVKKFWSSLDAYMNEMETDKDLDESSIRNIINENFDSLTEYLKKLDLKTDFIYFVKELTLNRKCCERFSINIRRDLMKKVNKIIKQLEKQSNEQSQSSTYSSSMDHLNEILANIQAHLKLIESVQKLFTSQTKITFAKKNKHFLQRIDKEIGIFFNIKFEFGKH